MGPGVFMGTEGASQRLGETVPQDKGAARSTQAGAVELAPAETEQRQEPEKHQRPGQQVPDCRGGHSLVGTCQTETYTENSHSV